jgi:hypothetical protein
VARTDRLQVANTANLPDCQLSACGQSPQIYTHTPTRSIISEPLFRATE